MRIGQMRLLDARSPLLFEKFVSVEVLAILPGMVVLVNPFTTQIFCVNNDIMEGFTYRTFSLT